MGLSVLIFDRNYIFNFEKRNKACFCLFDFVKMFTFHDLLSINIMLILNFQETALSFFLFTCSVILFLVKNINLTKLLKYKFPTQFNRLLFLMFVGIFFSYFRQQAVQKGLKIYKVYLIKSY